MEIKVEGIYKGYHKTKPNTPKYERKGKGFAELLNREMENIERAKENTRQSRDNA